MEIELCVHNFSNGYCKFMFLHSYGAMTWIWMSVGLQTKVCMGAKIFVADFVKLHFPIIGETLCWL